MQKKLRFLGLDVHAETIAVVVAEQDGEVSSLGIIANRAESVRKLIRKLGAVTLPVSASHRRFGSFPPAAEKRQAQPNRRALHSRHAQAAHLLSTEVRGLGVLYVMSMAQT